VLVAPAIVVLALTASATAAGAVDAVPLPMKGPPGAPVAITVSGCPAGTTDSVAARLRAAGGTPPPFNTSEQYTTAQTSGGGATINFRIMISVTPGSYVFDVFCVSEGGSVTDGPKTVPFEVALLPVSVTPNQGPAGTTITVTGSGCPVGTTDQVFVRIAGASDEVAPFDAGASNQFHTNPNPDGSFSITFAVPLSSPLGENAVESFCISEGGSVLAGPGFGVFNVSETGELAETGSTATPLTITGAALVLLGLALARVLGRRARV